MQSTPPISLAQKRAIVTGINREIGATIATTLALAGCHVVGVYYNEEARVTPVVEAVSRAGGVLHALHADLRHVSENERIVAEAVRILGGIDIFVANSGVTVFGPIEQMHEQAWDDVFDLNVKGAYFGARAAALQMKAQNTPGTIIFSSSVTGVTAMAGASIYGTSKAALRHIAATLGVELAPAQIRVNAIAIGATLNERNLADAPDYAQTWARLAPIGRVGQPQDVADTVLYLCSPLASMLVGQTLIIDGGWTWQSPLSPQDREE
ncbi:MAG: SDR family oxidoreductase [Chloroflexi bacterium]|nr:SDR family oxidoreductase [Chloroflexota bacterium]